LIARWTFAVTGTSDEVDLSGFQIGFTILTRLHPFRFEVVRVTVLVDPFVEPGEDFLFLWQEFQDVVGLVVRIAFTKPVTAKAEVRKHRGE